MSNPLSECHTDLDEDVDNDDDEGVGDVKEEPRLNGFDAEESVYIKLRISFFSMT